MHTQHLNDDDAHASLSWVSLVSFRNFVLVSFEMKCTIVQHEVKRELEVAHGKKSSQFALIFTVDFVKQIPVQSQSKFEIYCLFNSWTNKSFASRREISHLALPTFRPHKSIKKFVSLPPTLGLGLEIHSAFRSSLDAASHKRSSMMNIKIKSDLNLFSML